MKKEYKWAVQATEDGSLAGIYKSEDDANKRVLELDPLEERNESFYCGPYYEVHKIRITDEGHVIYI